MPTACFHKWNPFPRTAIPAQAVASFSKNSCSKAFASFCNVTPIRRFGFAILDAGRKKGLQCAGGTGIRIAPCFLKRAVCQPLFFFASARVWAAGAAAAAASAFLFALANRQPHRRRDHGQQDQYIRNAHHLTSFLPQSERHADQTHQARGDPRDAALPQHHVQRPLAAHFALDGGHGRHAGGVEQAEHQHGINA